MSKYNKIEEMILKANEHNYVLNVIKSDRLYEAFELDTLFNLHYQEPATSSTAFYSADLQIRELVSDHQKVNKILEQYGMEFVYTPAGKVWLLFTKDDQTYNLCITNIFYHCVDTSTYSFSIAERYMSISELDGFGEITRVHIPASGTDSKLYKATKKYKMALAVYFALFMFQIIDRYIAFELLIKDLDF